MVFKEDFLKDLSLPSGFVKTIIGLEDLKENEKLYLFNGKGFRKSFFHIGHYLIYTILSKLNTQKKIPVVFQLSSDQKRFNQECNYTLKLLKSWESSFINVLSTLEWSSQDFHLFSNTCRSNNYLLRTIGDYISSKIKLKKVMSIFGNLSLQEANYISIQLAPLLFFSKVYRDRRPFILVESSEAGYFYIIRDLCVKLGIKKPLIIEVYPFKDIILKAKMSTSVPRFAINLLDSSWENKLIKSISGDSSETDYLLYILSKLNALNLESLKEFQDLEYDYIQDKSSTLKYKREFCEVLKKKLNEKKMVLKEQLLKNLWLDKDIKLDLEQDIINTCCYCKDDEYKKDQRSLQER